MLVYKVHAIIKNGTNVLQTYSICKSLVHALIFQICKSLVHALISVEYTTDVIYKYKFIYLITLENEQITSVVFINVNWNTDNTPQVIYL